MLEGLKKLQGVSGHLPRCAQPRAKVGDNLRQGEPDVGERPDTSPDRSAS